MNQQPGGALGHVRHAVARKVRREKIDVWEAVEQAIEPSAARPKLDAAVEIATFTRRSGEIYAMLRSPDGQTYLRLTEPELALAKLMDGTRSLSDLIVVQFRATGSFGLSAVTDLVDDLRQAGFLEGGYVDVAQTAKERKRAQKRRVPSWLSDLARTRKAEWRGAHGFFAAMYRMGGRFFYTPAAAIVGGIILIAGGAAFFVVLARGKFELIGESAAGGILVLYAVDLASTFVHEAGHALSVIHSKRRINGAGMMLYLGLPAFYIDTTDMWMAPRGKRILSTAAGPLIEWVLAGAASLAALLLPVGPLTALAYKYAVLSYVTIVQNLIPFLRLDGYYVFMDALDTINLREESFSFLKQELPGKLRRREKLTRRERGYAAYGVLAALFVALAVALSALFWGGIFAKAIKASFEGGVLSALMVVALMILVFAPILRALVRFGKVLWRRQRAMFAAARRSFEQAWRRDAVSLLRALPLGGDLDDEAMDELAQHVRLRSVSAGESVVRQGERGEEFFVIRSGSFEVIRVEADGVEATLRTLERGRSFGEIALLEAAPRTATVRAREDGEVFAISKGTFDRLLADRVDLGETVRESLLNIEEMKKLPPFAALDDADAARLLSGARWELYGAGQRIVKQGEVADSFFVIGAGQAEVLENRRRVRVLGPGDYFGETALMLDVPRTATVRALTPLRLLELDRKAFRRIIARSFRTGKLAPSRQLAREWEH